MTRPNLYDLLKVLAILTMIVDHTGFFFFPNEVTLRVIGRTAFPLFLFLVGYNHSFKRRNSLRFRGIFLQLFVLGGWYLGYTPSRDINILLAIGLVRILLSFLQNINKQRAEIFIFLVSLFFVFDTYQYIDYGTMSIVFALTGYRARTYGSTKKIILLLVGVVMYHMYFMITSRGYPLNHLFLAIGGILLGSLISLSYKNTSLRTSNGWINNAVLFVSRYALEIYVGHIIMFTCFSYLL